MILMFLLLCSLGSNHVENGLASERRNVETSSQIPAPDLEKGPPEVPPAVKRNSRFSLVLGAEKGLSDILLYFREPMKSRALKNRVLGTPPAVSGGATALPDGPRGGTRRPPPHPPPPTPRWGLRPFVWGPGMSGHLFEP